VKLGAENRKEVIALAVLGVLAVLVVAYEFWPSSTTSSPSVTQSNSAAAGRTPARRGKGKGAVTEARLDPTLDLNLLKQSEEINYAGNGRNIFVQGSVATIEPAKRNGTTDHDEQAGIRVPPTPPPPPPITLKFFGFANKPGEPKRVFLSNTSEDVFIAGEGDIVDRRYRVLRIGPTSIEMEDVINNSRQSIQLTPG
jgi:hypothetical protein